MVYWILIILALNAIVLFQPQSPPIMKLNAAMVTVIAVFALVRIWQKKRQKAMEQLLDEISALQKENEDLRARLDDAAQDGDYTCSK